VAEEDRVHIWALGGMPVVSTPAELDMPHADDLTAAMQSVLGEHAIVIVDMTRTSFCDSSAISALIGAARLAAAGEREMRIAVASPQVLRIFAVTGVHELFSVFPTLHQALAARPAAPPDEPAASPAAHPAAPEVTAGEAG
jgi:anti-sigma B factor antagonist